MSAAGRSHHRYEVLAASSRPRLALAAWCMGPGAIATLPSHGTLHCSSSTRTRALACLPRPCCCCLRCDPRSCRACSTLSTLSTRRGGGGDPRAGNRTARQRGGGQRGIGASTPRSSRRRSRATRGSAVADGGGAGWRRCPVAVAGPTGFLAGALPRAVCVRSRRCGHAGHAARRCNRGSLRGGDGWRPHGGAGSDGAGSGSSGLLDRRRRGRLQPHTPVPSVPRAQPGCRALAPRTG